MTVAIPQEPPRGQADGMPHARVCRFGQVEQVESATLVPGDVVLLEAGDVVPADGRIVSSATLEIQEAALGDRTNLVFQDTQVTRGTATSVVTATGIVNERHRRHPDRPAGLARRSSPGRRLSGGSSPDSCSPPRLSPCSNGDRASRAPPTRRSA